MLETWSEVLSQSFQDMWKGVIDFSPNIIVSILIFVLGWVVAAVVGKWLAQIIRSLKLDDVLKSLGLQDLVNRAGYRLDSGAFIGALVKLFIILVFLIASLEILGLNQINDFLRDTVLGYIPKVIIASVILLLAAWIAEIVQKLIVGSTRAAGMSHAELFGGIAKWAIWIFAGLTALNQLNIAPEFTYTLFTGVVAMLALAGGLAFGLGGRDAAAGYIEKLREDISKK